MKRFLFSFLLSLSILGISWGFLSFGTGKWYQEYLGEWEYRRLHPELLPSPMIIRTFSMGHENSYASFTWLNFIQYIGDNIGGNKYLEFSHAILEHITALHPYFTRPYEIDLILAPLSHGENMTIEQQTKNKKYINNAITLWKQWIEILCDKEKIEKIEKQEIWEKLWNNTTLKNPCASGMLPYYIGFATYQMGDNKIQSSLYYKIASMNDDAPNASRLLGILALSADWDYLASAMNFALVGSTGYDIEPYTCRDLTTALVRSIGNNKPVNIGWINELQKKEKALKDTRDPKNPISQSSDNCYDMATRSIKQIYLKYIADTAKWTSAKNGKDLIKLGLFKTIPTISSHSGYTVIEKNGIWEYRAY